MRSVSIAVNSCGRQAHILGRDTGDGKQLTDKFGVRTFLRNTLNNLERTKQLKGHFYRSTHMNYEQPPPYSGPAPGAPGYPPQGYPVQNPAYPSCPPGPMGPYPPPGQPGYQGYPVPPQGQYGWQNAPPPGPMYGEAPKNTVALLMMDLFNGNNSMFCVRGGRTKARRHSGYLSDCLLDGALLLLSLGHADLMAAPTILPSLIPDLLPLNTSNHP
ncbi:hypothetical protein Z043_105253 [Scleropages formosus]|uniref:Cysteine-rich and transmembrane domain-containing protein 1 n=1 Tax=Scleropages formosus TaxID=113540 RepID=A0A0P7XGX9_SCLFO|nr:hypothetical protein Z043_105253 [Scleropages formosus]